MSSAEIVERLRSTSKGRLRYSPLKSTAELLCNLDESISPDYAHLITKLISDVTPRSLPRSPVSPATTPPLSEEALEYDYTYNEEEQERSPLLLSQDIENLEKSIEESFENEKNASSVQKRVEFTEKWEQIKEGNCKQLEAQLENRRVRREAEAAKRSAREKEKQLKIEMDYISLHQHYANIGFEIEQKLQRCEQEKVEQQQRRQRKVIERCSHLSKEAYDLQREFSIIHQQSRYPQLLSVDLMTTVKEAMEVLKNTLVSLNNEMESSDPDSKRVEGFQGSIEALRATASSFQCIVEESNQMGDSEVKRQQQEELAQDAARRAEELARQAAAAAQQARQLTEKAKWEEEEQQLATQQKESSSKSQKAAPNALGMPKSALGEYKALQSHLLEATKSLQPFTSDAPSKKYRFDLQKAVTLNVNAISAQSGQQVLDKLSNIKRLLRKQPVEVSGKKVSTNDHPLAYLFCCNLLAKKFVEQGQVAPKHDIFPYASVVTAIWTEFPDFGALFLAHLYQACPILVPYYVPRETGMTELDHMGYKISDDGKAESEDDFQKRMGGVVRLYAAVIQAEVTIFGTELIHPQGLGHGWMWLARVLNGDPHPSITATALCEFLEVCGYALQREYKKQFKKLFIALFKDYLPKIESVTTQRGPLERLKQFLEGCARAGKIPEPEGLLKLEFWRSKSQGGGIVSA